MADLQLGNFIFATSDTML